MANEKIDVSHDLKIDVRYQLAGGRGASIHFVGEAALISRSTQWHLPFLKTYNEKFGYHCPFSKAIF